MDFESDRQFQMWDYSVSHRQILFRSPRSESEVTSMNIDLVFWGVAYIEAPTVLDGFLLIAASNDEVERMKPKTAMEFDRSMAYCLESRRQRYLLIASGYQVLRNSLGIFDSSLVYVHKDRPVTDYGEVLAHSEQRM
jgi:hypothetical protein